MAAARRTTSKTTSTAKPEDTTSDSAPKASTAKAEDTKAEGTSTPEVKVETNPELEGNADKVADAQREPEHDKATKKFLDEQEKQRKALLEEGKPTSEAYNDPHVNLANLPVNHDPVVTGDHASASNAASVPVDKIEQAAPRQISQMDTSNFGNAVTDSLSKKAVVDEDSKDSDSK